MMVIGQLTLIHAMYNHHLSRLLTEVLYSMAEIMEDPNTISPNFSALTRLLYDTSLSLISLSAKPIVYRLNAIESYFGRN